MCYNIFYVSVMPKIIQCKMELDNSIKDCDEYSGKLELVNDMHTLLVDNYCVDDGQRLLGKLFIDVL